MKLQENSDFSSLNENGSVKKVDPNNKLQSKRENCRKRSKRARDRKKAYYEELEIKIKHLEEENFRLQNLIVAYRAEKINMVDEELVPYQKYHSLGKTDAIKKFMDADTLKFKPKSDISLYDNLNSGIFSHIEKHREFLDMAFEAIINHPFPNWKMKYWGDLNGEPIKDYSIFQKYSRLLKNQKLSKYQLPEFCEKYNITKADEYIASMNITSKKQYNFMKKYASREYSLKKTYLEGIDHLLKAKEIFEKSVGNHLLGIQFLLKSKILTDKQVLESKFQDSLCSRDNAFNGKELS